MTTSFKYLETVGQSLLKLLGEQSPSVAQQLTIGRPGTISEREKETYEKKIKDFQDDNKNLQEELERLQQEHAKLTEEFTKTNDELNSKRGALELCNKVAAAASQPEREAVLNEALTKATEKTQSLETDLEKEKQKHDSETKSLNVQILELQKRQVEEKAEEKRIIQEQKNLVQSLEQKNEDLKQKIETMTKAELESEGKYRASVESHAKQLEEAKQAGITGQKTLQDLQGKAQKYDKLQAALLELITSTPPEEGKREVTDEEVKGLINYYINCRKLGPQCLEYLLNRWEEAITEVTPTQIEASKEQQTCFGLFMPALEEKSRDLITRSKNFRKLNELKPIVLSKYLEFYQYLTHVRSLIADIIRINNDLCVNPELLYQLFARFKINTPTDDAMAKPPVSSETKEKYMRKLENVFSIKLGDANKEEKELIELLTQDWKGFDRISAYDNIIQRFESGSKKLQELHHQFLQLHEIFRFFRIASQLIYLQQAIINVLNTDPQQKERALKIALEDKKAVPSCTTSPLLFMLIDLKSPSQALCEGILKIISDTSTIQIKTNELVSLLHKSLLNDADFETILNITNGGFLNKLILTK